MDGLLDWNDADVPTVSRRFHRRARKRHKCCECGREIKPREIYQVIEGLWDGEWETYKTCIECAEDRDKLAKESGYCVMLGALKEAKREWREEADDGE